ncbi:MAG: hypothetical protein QOF76_1755, partial [Solirubrobacteraceae bacterium]|nr:hypothetical protein [Solirubrobacteraceae bacterium]
MPVPFRARRLLPGLAVLAALVTLSAGLGAAPAAGTASPGAPARTTSSPTAHYAVNRPLCEAPSGPSPFRCYAVERHPATAGTPGAYRVDGKYGS